MPQRRPDTQERKEQQRMGGSKERIGPGGGMPSATDLDRPNADVSTYARHGDGTMSTDRGIRKIQDQGR